MRENGSNNGSSSKYLNRCGINRKEEQKLQSVNGIGKENANSFVENIPATKF